MVTLVFHFKIKIYSFFDKESKLKQLIRVTVKVIVLTVLTVSMVSFRIRYSCECVIKFSRKFISHFSFFSFEWNFINSANKYLRESIKINNRYRSSRTLHSMTVKSAKTIFQNSKDGRSRPLPAQSGDNCLIRLIPPKSILIFRIAWNRRGTVRSVCYKLV